MTSPTVPPEPPPATAWERSRDADLDKLIGAARHIVHDPVLRAEIELRLVGLRSPQTPAGTAPAGREERE